MLHKGSRAPSSHREKACLGDCAGWPVTANVDALLSPPAQCGLRAIPPLVCACLILPHRQHDTIRLFSPAKLQAVL